LEGGGGNRHFEASRAGVTGVGSLFYIPCQSATIPVSYTLEAIL